MAGGVVVGAVVVVCVRAAVCGARAMCRGAGGESAACGGVLTREWARGGALRAGGLAGAGGAGRSLFGLVVAGQAADPDVAVANGVAVILQEQRSVAVGFVVAEGAVLGIAVERLAVVGDDAVEEEGDVGGADDFAAVEAGRLVDDVVDIPLAGLADGVDERGPLAIDRAGLAIGVGGLVEGIEDLDFVAAGDVDAAIAAVLAGAGDVGGFGPLEVDLAIAERLAGEEVARAGSDFEIAVEDLPAGGDGSASHQAAAVLAPLRKVFAIEEDDGVGGRSAAGRAGVDFVRMGTVGVMNVPFLAGKNGGIAIALLGGHDGGQPQEAGGSQMQSGA